MGLVPRLDDGEGVLLRPALDTDGERWLQMLHDPECLRYGSPAFVPLAADVAGLANSLAASRSSWADGTPGTMVVALTDHADVFEGCISWRWTASEQLAVAELGYSIHPDARGRGVGRRAIRTLTRWLLSPHGRGLARVQLDHSVENLASCRVAVAAGFEREGVRRGFLPLRDAAHPEGVRRHDVCLHGCLEPPPVSAS